jgi:hypothetical protein
VHEWVHAQFQLLFLGESACSMPHDGSIRTGSGFINMLLLRRGCHGVIRLRLLAGHLLLICLFHGCRNHKAERGRILFGPCLGLRFVLSLRLGCRELNTYRLVSRVIGESTATTCTSSSAFLRADAAESSRVTLLLASSALFLNSDGSASAWGAQSTGVPSVLL